MSEFEYNTKDIVKLSRPNDYVRTRLNSFQLFANQWEKLSITGDATNEKEYYWRFRKMLVKMSVLNFSKRHRMGLGYSTLHELIFSSQKLDGTKEPLLLLILQEDHLDDKVVLITDKEDKITSVFSGLGNFNAYELEGLQLAELFENSSFTHPDQEYYTKMNIGYKGEVIVKLKQAVNAEDKGYIIDII